jgi:hypothetical protein
MRRPTPAPPLKSTRAFVERAEDGSAIVLRGVAGIMLLLNRIVVIVRRVDCFFMMFLVDSWFV